MAKMNLFNFKYLITETGGFANHIYNIYGVEEHGDIYEIKSWVSLEKLLNVLRNNSFNKLTKEEYNYDFVYCGKTNNLVFANDVVKNVCCMYDATEVSVYELNKDTFSLKCLHKDYYSQIDGPKFISDIFKSIYEFKIHIVNTQREKRK